jgi:hypothetical protein
VKRAIVIAAIAVGTIVLCIAAPLRQVSGDTVPGRIGGAVLRCTGSFDLSRLDWVGSELAHHSVFYYSELDHAGQVTSVFGPAPAVIGALALPAFGPGASIDDEALRRRERGAAGVLLAIAAVLLAIACRARTSWPRAALAAATAVLSFAGAATLGQGLWQATTALPPLMAGLAVIAHREQRPRLALAAPALLLVAVMIRPTVIVLALGLGVQWALATKSRRSWLWAIAIAALAIAPFVAYNAVHSYSPLPLGQWHANARDTAHVFGAPTGIAGLLVSPARGLLWFAPVAIVGAVVALRRKSALGITLVLNLFAMAAFFKWHGGQAYGPRLLAETTWLAIYAACEVRLAVLAPAVAVTVVVGQLGLWRFQPEQWEVRRRPETNTEAFWDVRDNPIAATLDSLPPGTHIAVDSPPRSRLECASGRVITH